MAEELSGEVDGSGLRVGVIVAQFNEAVTSRLLDGARKALERHGVREDSITIVQVPGSLELPQAAQRMARSGRWDALVALGCVIRGETAHFDLVAAETARGIAQVARESGTAIGFGVLTTEDTAQAMARSGGALGNRGSDAVEAALRMASVNRQLDDQAKHPRAAKARS